MLFRSENITPVKKKLFFCDKECEKKYNEQKHSNQKNNDNDNNDNKYKKSNKIRPFNPTTNHTTNPPFTVPVETILEVLPAVLKMVINDNNKRGFLLDWEYGCYKEIFVEKQDNESLADTAGRLLIKLHENNLIKFNNENKNSGINYRKKTKWMTMPQIKIIFFIYIKPIIS